MSTNTPPNGTEEEIDSLEADVEASTDKKPGGINAVLTWARNALGGGAGKQGSETGPDAISRRGFLMGRGLLEKAAKSPDGSNEAVSEDVEKLGIALQHFAHATGVLYALKVMGSEVFLDLDNAKVVDKDKANKLMKAGSGGSEGVVAYIISHYGYGLALGIFGLYVGNKVFRSPNRNQMADAVSRKTAGIANLNSDLNAVGLIGNATGQIAADHLDNPNLDRRLFSSYFKNFSDEPANMLNMLPQCADNIARLRASIPNGATDIPNDVYQQIAQLAERYTLTNLRTFRQIHVSTINSIDPFIEEIRALRANPGMPETEEYLERRLEAVSAVISNTQTLRIVDNIKRSNEDISREVPFFAAIGDVIRGDGQVSRRQFFKHVGILGTVGFLLGWSRDNPFSSTSTDGMSEEDAEEQRKKAKEGLEELRKKHGVGGGKTLDNVIDEGEPDSRESRPDSSGPTRNNESSETLTEEEQRKLIEDLARKSKHR